jgi:hypothetical protein
MGRLRDDLSEYRFFARDDATLDARLDAPDGRPVLAISGNRAGLLCLSNVLLWFIGNGWGREFLCFGSLPFVRLSDVKDVVLRLSPDDSDVDDGLLRLGGGDRVEWEISEAGLRRVALVVHHIVSMPEHEYDRLRVRPGSDLDVEVRLSDVREWL